jgi:hypothetical protein
MLFMLKRLCNLALLNKINIMETKTIKLIKEPNSLGWSKVIYTDGTTKYVSVINTILNQVKKYNVNYDDARYLADNYLDVIFQIYNAERYNPELLDSIMNEWEKNN